jgi:hypothetical protein
VDETVGDRLRRLETPGDDELDRIEIQWLSFQSGRIEFLNEWEEFDGMPLWNREGRDRLWDLNLHYFDYAVDFIWLGLARGNRQIQEQTLAVLVNWTETYTIGSQHGWEPYAISLRVVNWLKLLFLCRETIQHDIYRKLLSSVYRQCLYLRDHIEYHLQGNHLLENFRALLIAGQVFNSQTAEQWRTLAGSHFVEELGEEVLPDGGHFERSPSYHCVVLDHSIDVLLFLDAEESLAREVRGLIETMGNFLTALPNVDYEFPILNDCGANVCRSPSTLLRRLESHNIACQPDRSRVRLSEADPFAYSLPDTGLYVIEWHGWLFLIDGGAMGPRYQPSHAHCDTLAFWLYFEGRPVFVEA